MRLEDLRPAEASFELESTGRKYTLRPISLSDEIWLRDNIGDEWTKIFGDEIDMEQFSRIIYHQIKDKDDFTKKEFVVIDEEGNKTTEYVGGYKALQLMIVGLRDKMAVIKAFNDCMGASRPTVSEDEKKKK